MSSGSFSTLVCIKMNYLIKIGISNKLLIWSSSFSCFKLFKVYVEPRKFKVTLPMPLVQSKTRENIQDLSLPEMM